MKRITRNLCYSVVLGLAFLGKINPARAQINPNPVFTSYAGQETISATESVTLKPGFVVPSGSNLRIFINSNVTLGTAPTLTQNYVLTTKYLNPFSTRPTTLTTGDARQAIEYLDGLGRPIQQVNVKASPSFSDIVTPIGYDSYGRGDRKYLAYSTNALVGGGFKADAIAAQKTYYESTPPAGQVSTSFAVEREVLEASPISRILEQGFAGAVWQPAASRTTSSGRTHKLEYLTNNTESLSNTATTRNVVHYGVNLDAAGVPTLTANGFYTAGSLKVTLLRNENWESASGFNNRLNTVEDYKDKSGNIVLTRTFNLNGNTQEILSTYYVYDDLGNLTYVLPPGRTGDYNPDSGNLPTAAQYTSYVYQYRYDERNRLVQKQLPGKGIEYIVYNKLDQVVAVQDANQRGRNEWTINKYDAHGRPILQGLWINTSTLDQVRNAANTQTAGNLWEARSTTTANGYTNRAWPTTALGTVLSTNYYDSYGSIPGLPHNESTSYTTKRIGLLVASKVAVIGNNSPLIHLWTVNYYDNEGRVVRTYAQNLLEGFDDLTNAYNFSGELTSSTRSHSPKVGSATSIAMKYTYDHMGRPKETRHRINLQTEVILSRQVYNEIGQLRQQSLHSENGGGNFLTTTTQSYNERGWLTEMSNPFFSQKLAYNVVSGTSARQYGGNIAEQEWRQGSEAYQRFSYTYDRLNRLTDGVATSMREELSYDKMGNIASLKRDNGTAISYSYSGNRLQSVTG
ncbi:MULTISPECIES: DUF6443 domain-containing protein [Sphingobacterium]|uniref:DUF6443 domain-containing protein n=1 Tax=Sphingobacterium populi TaxID=1812824 RepID=A0ABW5UH26_9SPHI|nr:DUF6443 domain-containing protein [Sphingobacterium sp. CFCC 11742]